MRTRFRASLVAAIAALAAAAMVAPDLAMAQCGGGHRRHHDPQDNGNDNHRGRRHHPNAGNDGPDHQRGHPRHGGRRDRNIDIEAEIGIGRRPEYTPDYDPAYGYGRIGPPTQACDQLARLRNGLARLFNLRREVEAGDTVAFADDHGRLIGSHGAGDVRERDRDRVVGDTLASGGDPVDAFRENERWYDRLRDMSLQSIDARIARTQNRIGQLEYNCEE